MNLIRAVARRSGVRMKNIKYLEVLQHGERVKIRVNERIEFHPEPKDFQTHFYLPFWLDDYKFVSVDIPRLWDCLKRMKRYQYKT